ncbi:MAG: DUF2789 family protein [Pseudomonas sp.]|uniref:DUF2789 family protein n=1 Tax=Pseudomonas sp. TaxID=306 RepID=UPI0027208992|nr:DUF2789 family protein [Pseudomonas sp.]
MQSTNPDLTSLFQQLGLPAGAADVDSFVSQHAPLPERLALADASFWNLGQATFLREQLVADAEWAELIDQLDLLLRRPR